MKVGRAFQGEWAAGKSRGQREGGEIRGVIVTSLVRRRGGLMVIV